jgi:hypothetical protein
MATVAYQEQNDSVLVSEFLVGGANVILGVENFSKGKAGDRSLTWIAVGVGSAGLGIALSTLEDSRVSHFDLIASAIALAGTAVRIRGPFPGQNNVGVGFGMVRVCCKF